MNRKTLGMPQPQLQSFVLTCILRIKVEGVGESLGASSLQPGSPHAGGPSEGCSLPPSGSAVTSSLPTCFTHTSTPNSHFLSPYLLNPFLRPAPLLGWVTPAPCPASHPAEPPGGRGPGGRRGGEGRRRLRQRPLREKPRPALSPRRCCGRSRSRGG